MDYLNLIQLLFNTRDRLLRIGKINTSQCLYCERVLDSTAHLLTCPISSQVANPVISVYGTLEIWWIQQLASNCFWKAFSLLKVEKCKAVIFLCIFCIFLCIINWLRATLKTYFYQKIQIKCCSRDQNTNKSQPPKQIYDKRCFLNMSCLLTTFCVLNISTVAWL